MKYSKNNNEIIKARSSCRTYIKRPIDVEKQKLIKKYLAQIKPGPFGNKAVFHLISASDDDLNSLKDLGTYGFIKGAPSFIIGSVQKKEKNLEDFGYSLEKIVLFITDIGLGTCWLGGSFNKSTFAKRISLSDDDVIPAVTPVGYRDEKGGIVDSLIKWSAKSKLRKEWESLFFLEKFGQSLLKKSAGKYEDALEMLRLAPSASNRQPWRVIKDKNKNIFHFYLQRTKGYYRKDNFLKITDLQRVDMGIAMCHFELAAVEAGIKGKWTITNPGLDTLPEFTEYVCTWQE